MAGIRETILALGTMLDAHPIALKARDFDRPIRRALYDNRAFLCMFIGGAPEGRMSGESSLPDPLRMDNLLKAHIWWPS